MIISSSTACLEFEIFQSKSLEVDLIEWTYIGVNLNEKGFVVEMSRVFNNFKFTLDVSVHLRVSVSSKLCS